MKNEEKPGNMENEVVVTMFRMWIRKRIKEILDQMENLNFEKDFKEVNIVYTSFAYQNGFMIDLLKKRGRAIKDNDMPGKEKIEEKINKKLKNKT